MSGFSTRQTCRVLAWLAAGVLAASSVQAQEEPDGTWSPWLGIGFGVHTQGAQATVDTSFGVSRQGDDPIVSPIVDFDLSLLAPALSSRWGGPRPFAHAAVQIPTTTDYLIENTTTQVDQTQLEVGAQVFWDAGLGVAFTPFGLGGQPIRLKPSLDYVGQALDFSGRAVDRINVGMGMIEDFVTQASAPTEIVHSLGPRLAVEALLGQTFELPLAVSVFAEVGAFWVLSDREVRFAGSGAAGPASFDLELDSYFVQGGVGMRLSWSPR